MARLLRRIFPRYPRRLSRRVRNAAVYWPAHLAMAAAAPLSLADALPWAERIGGLLFRVWRQPRRLALEHLRLAFGDELSEVGRQRLARAAFINVARCFCEIAKADEIRALGDTYFEVDGWENAEAALAAGRGAVAVTGHIGNWELLAAYLAQRGLRIGTIARRIFEPRLNQLLVDFRARQGVQTILRESPHATHDMLRVLKDNGLLTVVIDQDTRISSAPVPFFGRSARTPASAAALALRRGVPVVAAFIQRRAHGGHRITILPPFELPASGDQKADLRALTAAFNHTIETQIRNNPAEWVWWHRRWRQGPVSHLDIERDLPYSYSPSVLHGKT